jgi:hypothetical protein
MLVVRNWWMIIVAAKAGFSIAAEFSASNTGWPP